MDKKIKITPAFLISAISAAVAVIMAVIRVFALVGSYDAARSVYRHGSAFAVALDYVFAGVVLIFAVAAVILSARSNDKKLPAPNGFVSFSGFFAAFAFIALPIWIFAENGLKFNTRGAVGMLETASLILALPCAVYFLATALKKEFFMRNTLVLSFFPALWAIVNLMGEYFSTETAMTSPARIFDQVAMLALMVYFINETRFHLARPSTRSFYALGSASVILLAASSIPSFVMILAGNNMHRSPMFYLAQLAVAIYILARMLSLSQSNEPLPTQEENDEPVEETEEE